MNSSHNNQPIGIFDSGVGGLSIAKKIAEQLPQENLIYVADSAFAPYGDITNKKIVERVNTVSDWLIQKECKTIVIACNTATVNAIDQLRKRVTIPIIGVEPAIKPAANNDYSNKVGILVTQATSVNNRFLTLVEKHTSSKNVIIQPCLGLVELIEEGQVNSAAFKNLLQKHLTPLIEANVDTIVLGCTHYPFMVEIIKAVMPYPVTLIETATPVVNQLQRQLNNFQLAANYNNTDENINGAHQFFSSKISSNQTQVFKQLWHSDIELQLFTAK